MKLERLQRVGHRRRLRVPCYSFCSIVSENILIGIQVRFDVCEGGTKVAA